MTPLELFLYLLAATPFTVLLALLVNLVANNVTETRHTAEMFPRPRPRTKTKATR